MALGKQDAPVSYDTLDAAKAAAAAAHTLVWAVVDSVQYRVYPNGKTVQI